MIIDENGNICFVLPNGKKVCPFSESGDLDDKKNKDFKVFVRPSMKIGEISQTGEVVIDFSEPMRFAQYSKTKFDGRILD